MVRRGRTNPRIPTRHRHPHHRTCAVPQAPRRLPTHRGHARRHPPNPQTLQHPRQDHHRARRRARCRGYRGTPPRQHRRNSWHTRLLSRRDPKRQAATRKHQRSPSRNRRPPSRHRASQGRADVRLRRRPRRRMRHIKWRSQGANIRLRALAEQLVADVLTRKHDDGSPLSRPTFDQLLLTAHQRVKAHAA